MQFKDVPGDIFKCKCIEVNVHGVVRKLDGLHELYHAIRNPKDWLKLLDIGKREKYAL